MSNVLKSQRWHVDFYICFALVITRRTRAVGKSVDLHYVGVSEKYLLKLIADDVISSVEAYSF